MLQTSSGTPIALGTRFGKYCRHEGVTVLHRYLGMPQSELTDTMYLVVDTDAIP